MVHDYAPVMHEMTLAPLPPSLNLINPKQLAEILHKAEATVRSDIHRAPERLPPRVVMPNSNKLLWLRSTVESWLVQHQDVGSVQ
jgi:hypothetical protein